MRCKGQAKQVKRSVRAISVCPPGNKSHTGFSSYHQLPGSLLPPWRPPQTTTPHTNQKPPIVTQPPNPFPQTGSPSTPPTYLR